MSQPLHCTRMLCLAGALSLLSWNAAQAAQPRRMPPTARAAMARPAVGLAKLGDIVWSFLTGRLDTGCQMDPNGGCGFPAKLQLDNGCKMDPNGLCVPQAISQTDNGCKMDPDGNLQPASCVAPR